MQTNNLSRKFISEWFLSLHEYKKYKKEFPETEPIESLPKKCVYLDEFLEEIREEILDNLISQTESLSCKLMGSVFEIHLEEEGIRIGFYGGATVYDDDYDTTLDVAIYFPIIPSLEELQSKQLVGDYLAWSKSASMQKEEE